MRDLEHKMHWGEVLSVTESSDCHRVLQAGKLKRYHNWWLAAVQWMDIILLLAAGVFATVFAKGNANFVSLESVAILLTTGLAALLCHRFHFYRPWRGSTVGNELKIFFAIWLFSLGVCGTAIFLYPSFSSHSQTWLAAFFVFGLVVISGSRIALRKLLTVFRRRGHNTRRAIIVGANELGKAIARHLETADWTGVRVTEFYDDDQTKHGSQQRGISVVGDIDELLTRLSGHDANRHSIDQIWLALPYKQKEQIQRIISSTSDKMVSLHFVPRSPNELECYTYEEFAGIPMVILNENPIVGIKQVFKTLSDWVVASTALFLAAPAMVFIALAIKATSAGPVIFKQRRYGLDGREIQVWKFRSMTVCEDSSDKIVQASKGDSRVTAVGAFLRRTSLDELPQLINVLLGDMSVVGPRPHAVAHNELFRPKIKGYMLRHTVKPGITGLAQVNGWRGETDTLYKMEKRVEQDLEYINNWSLWLDVKILFKTIYTGFVSKNAY